MATLLALATAACGNGTGADPERGPAPRSAPGEGSAASPSATAVRVAAVGDSITAGKGLPDPERDSHPAQLGRLLGDGYVVRNFGVSGRTLLRKGDQPYWDDPAFQRAQAFAPQIVVILLGTNDAKPQNWRHQEEFVGDYLALIAAFRRLPSRPLVLVCSPPPVFRGRSGIQASVITAGVLPRIARVARDAGVPIVDLHAALAGHPELFSDGIHPNADGARRIAETVGAVIRARTSGRGDRGRGVAAEAGEASALHQQDRVAVRVTGQ